MSLKVIDLSSNQSITNWSSFNAAVDAVYLRVYRSNGAQDTKWRNFYANFNGPRAPYIFLRPPSEASFANQFATFWGWANDVVWEWGPVIDAEYAGLTASQLRSAIATCRSVTGHHRVYVYIGHANLVGAVPFSSFATDSDVRVIGSRYFRNNFATAFDDFGIDDSHLDMVQYWDAATVAGVGAPCDINNARQLLTISTTTGDVDMPLTVADATLVANTLLDLAVDRQNGTYDGTVFAPGTQTSLRGLISRQDNAIALSVRNTNSINTNVDAVDANVDAADAHESAQLATVDTHVSAIGVNLTALAAQVTALAGQVATGGLDPNTFAAALGPILAPLLTSPSLTPDQAEAAVTAALRAEEARIAALP